MDFDRPKKPAPVTTPRPHPVVVPSVRPAPKKRINRKTLILSSAGIALLIIVIITTMILTNSSTSPSYTTFTPNGTSASKLGGWKQVNPTDQEPIYAFTDTLGGIAITVSQQEVPGQYKNNPGALLKEMTKVAYTELGETGAFIGTSAKGPQSIILIKETTLILIKSAATIPDKDWVAYINSLQ